MESADGLSVVLGAGPVGQAVVAHLRGKGRQVRLVTRSGRASVPQGGEVLAADVAHADSARRTCAGAAVVYGCLGLNYQGWPERWPPMMTGMLAGAETARARFIFMDNLCMYGPVDGPLIEDLPLTAYGKKPAVRAALTRMWQEAHTAGRVVATAVRSSDFYGPGVTNAALGAFSFGRIAAGKGAQCVGSVDHLHSIAYVPDIARALVTVGKRRPMPWDRRGMCRARPTGQSGSTFGSLLGV